MARSSSAWQHLRCEGFLLGMAGAAAAMARTGVHCRQLCIASALAAENWGFRSSTRNPAEPGRGAWCWAEGPGCGSLHTCISSALVLHRVCVAAANEAHHVRSSTFGMVGDCCTQGRFLAELN